MVYLDNNQLLQEIYIPRQSVRNDASPEYATKTELENAIENEVIRADGKYATKTDLLPYATTGWVESQDYVNSEEMASAITDAITSETARTEETYQKISEMSAYSTTNEVESMIDDAVSGKMDTSAMSAYSTTQQMNQAIDDSAAYTTGWVASQGYLTGFTETDPIFTGSPAYGITSQDITNWNSVSGKADASKFNDYTPSSGFSTINGSAITSGEAIVIETGGNYSAGTNIQIEDNVISVTGISVPTKLSELDNDEGFITTADTKDFVTSGDVKTQIEDYGYITEDAISGKADTTAVTQSIADAVSGKVDISSMTAYTPSSGFATINGSAITEGGDIVISGGSGSEYSAGTNIQIEDDVISVTGITSYTGITSGDVVTALGYTPISGVDLSDYYTSAETDTAISNSTSGKADTTAVTASISAATAATTGWVESQNYLTGYTETDPIFTGSPAYGITTEDIDSWNSVSGKVDTSAMTSYYTSAETDTAISNAVSGKADTTAVTDVETHILNVEEQTAIALLELDNRVDEFNSELTDVDTHIDEIEEQTAIALVDLDTRVNEISGSSVTTGTVESMITAATSGLQETLVSGTNIKTINNQSLLGSGNIDIQGGGGSGETFVELTKAEYEALTAYSENTTYVITDADAVNLDDFVTTGNLQSYYTSAETNTAIANAVSGKTDKVSVTANTGRQFPRWNTQGVVTGTTGNTVYEQSLNINGTSKTMLQTTNSSFGTIYAPTSAGSQGQPLLSNGSGAPVWGSYKFQFISQSAYDAITTKDSTTIYFIISEN